MNGRSFDDRRDTAIVRLFLDGVEALAGDDESELVESAENGQISAAKAAEGSVDHVEVFRMSV
jgi:hypothetical protein